MNLKPVTIPFNSRLRARFRGTLNFRTLYIEVPEIGDPRIYYPGNGERPSKHERNRILDFCANQFPEHFEKATA